jgi:SDR family mycofactocin-dependent oxidoreductase
MTAPGWPVQPDAADAEPGSEAPVALVTGAARGIGAATVRTLVQRGYGVVALDLATTESAQPHDRVAVVRGDVRDPGDVAAAVDLARERWGRLDVAVAAAAMILGGRPLWQTPVADLEQLWRTDLVGVWNVAAAAVPAMLAGPDPSRGRMVAIASAAGTRGLYGLSAYTVVKHAVVGLVRGLAADLVGTGVSAVAVAPGATRTVMLEETARLYGLDSTEPLADSVLLRRLLEPTELAEAVGFCCSRAGAVLNGSVLAADGGAA